MITEKSGFDRSLAQLAPPRLTEIRRLGHGECGSIRLSARSVKSQVYTQRGCTEWTLLCVSHSVSSPASSTRSAATYCESKHVCGEANTHLLRIGSNLTFQKAPPASECVLDRRVCSSHKSDYFFFLSLFLTHEGPIVFQNASVTPTLKKPHN